MSHRNLPESVRTISSALLPIARRLRSELSGMMTSHPVFVYASVGDRGSVGVVSEDKLSANLVKDFLTLKGWKVREAKKADYAVGSTPVLRRIGEAWNLFKGKYPLIGIDNHPGPIGSMLVGGAIGAGSLFALGSLLSLLSPQGFGERLPISLGILGGAAGAFPGAMWGITNYLTGRKFNDPYLLNPPGNFAHINYYQKNKQEKKTASFQFGEPSVTDVHIPSFRRTMFLSNASPETRSLGEAVFQAAKFHPDPNSPGSSWVTGHQLGQLAMGMAKDYAKGLLVGSVLNTLVGTPYSAPTIGAGLATAGLVRSVLESFTRPQF